MSWQDDLQHLDEELAAGRLSTDDYRRRRDDLIARVATEQGGGTAGQGSTVDQPPEPQGSPFPPAFRWDAPGPNETTSVIKAVPGPAAESSEETQVVRAPEHPTAPPGYDDSERTQVVQATPPPFNQPAYRQSGAFSSSSDQRPAWTQEESAPPWASSDLAPIQEPNAGWMMQGPEFFEPERKEPATMRIIVVVAALAVLAGIAFGAWFLWGRNVSNATDPGQADQQPAVTTTEPEPEDPLAPVDVGGNKEPKDVDSFRDLEAVGFLTPAELDAIGAAGARESRLLITNLPEGKATILVAQAASSQLATTARDDLTELQIGYGFAPRIAPPGISSVEVLDQTDVPPTLRALYTSGDLIIRIEMRGDNLNGGAADNRELRETITTFEEIIDQQLEKLPADG